MSDLPVNAVVFDFDGLLVDTEVAMLASWQSEWRAHGLELDLDGFWGDHGGDLTEERYARLAERVGAGYDRASSHARRVAHRDSLLRGVGLRPGMQAWLTEAVDLGLRLALASSSPRSWVDRVLELCGAACEFEVMATGDEVAAPKPDPSVYRLAIDRLGLDAARAVAVEDAPHGVRAAQAAGLRCIAVATEHVPADRLRHADLVLTSAAGVPLQDALAAATSPDARRH